MADVIADPSSSVVVLVGVALAMFALALRLVVHLGATPSGVDTWYFLASADELRRTRRLPVSLPRYLLHDRVESYPPGFVVFLALLPHRFLQRYFWIVAPVADTAHLLLLYAFVYRLSEDLPTAAIAGLIYAVVPQLIAETRSLNPRSLGLLLSSVAMLLILRAELPDDLAGGLRLGASPWLPGAAVVAIAFLFLTQPTGGIALGVATLTLTVVFREWHYVAYPVAGFIAAFILTRGTYVNVLMNHVHAIRFWRRNLRYRGAEPILDSPIYGAGDGSPRGRTTRWRSMRWQLVRLVAENPFIVPMVLLPPPDQLWGLRMYWWAIGVIAWAVATTVVPPLRVFGPGYIYLKAMVFPIAVSLSFAVGSRQLDFLPLVAGAGALSVASILFFYGYVRTRTTELTSSLPKGLAELTATLAMLPADRVLVLPTMYADYVSYNAKKSVLWGGHSGDLTQFEQMAPVVRVAFHELIAKYRVRYALIDLSYVTLSQIGLGTTLRELHQKDSFALYEVAD